MKKDDSDSKNAKVLVSESFTSQLIDRFLMFLKKTAFDNFISKNENWLVKIGLYGIYFIGIMSFIFALALPLKVPGFGILQGILIGIIALLVAVVLNYAAYKILPNLNLLISGTPVKISSSSFLTVCALFTGIFGVIALLASIVFAIQTGSFMTFVGGIFTFIVCEYWMAMFLNPQTLKVEVVKNVSAGEEFIGLLSFFMKALLKLIPLQFAAAMLYGSFYIVMMLFTRYDDPYTFLYELRTFGQVAALALLPVGGYIFFLFYYFAIDIANAILEIPNKIEKSNQK